MQATKQQFRLIAILQYLHNQKQWPWPFTPDPRQEYADSSDDESNTSIVTSESSEIQTRSKSAQEASTTKSKWERFPEALAEAARHQSQLLYHYLDRTLDRPAGINLYSQFARLPNRDGIGAWIALLKWSDLSKDPVQEKEEAVDVEKRKLFRYIARFMKDKEVHHTYNIKSYRMM